MIPLATSNCAVTVSDGDAAEVMQPNNLHILYIQEVPEKWQKWGLRTKFQILNLKQSNPRRTMVVWDSYRYHLEAFNNSSGSVLVQLSDIGCLASTYLLEPGCADELLAGVLSGLLVSIP